MTLRLWPYGRRASVGELVVGVVEVGSSCEVEALQEGGGVPWGQAVSAKSPDSAAAAAAAAAGAVGMLTCGQATLCSALHPSSSSSYRARAAQGVHREGGPFTPVGLGPEGEVFVFTFGALGTAGGLLLGLSIPFYAQKGVHL